jgi:hypothetical protein
MADHTSSNPPPPHQYSLKGIAIARFVEAFGDATNTMTNDHQWSLKTAPFASDLYVLLYGPVNQPLVWILDPNDRNDGASCSMIEDESAIIDIIDHIRHRVIKGSRTRRKESGGRQRNRLSLAMSMSATCQRAVSWRMMSPFCYTGGNPWPLRARFSSQALHPPESTCPPASGVCSPRFRTQGRMRTDGRWKDTLTADDCADYESRAKQELGDECAKWLATGVESNQCGS